ncbi:MAG: Lrp/AsnC family transcriptional regulator [Nitrososphaerota archaeon]|jgi:DNA-binding Lrp family transcriptional regulator|nr:Lrp/AsnC family transcriptional regulator [Nitrososphaerota archaeon]MDG6948995.1 Lrp/AsnC family transcriptional regulator [Nitrososphaerota archaeon]
MMDAKDSKILAELVCDGRRPIVDIASHLGLPRATVQDRLRRMMESGVIRKFVAIPDYSKIGKRVMAYVFVAFGGEGRLSQRTLAEAISKMPGVYEVSVISGEWDILLKVRANTLEEIGNLVVDRLRSMSGVEKTETCVSFQTIKESF